MTTPNYTLQYALHQHEADDGSWASLRVYPSVGSPWITERPTPGKNLTVHQAMVLFTAMAENTITLGLENKETAQKIVLVKMAGTCGWLAPGSPILTERFIHLLNTCYVHALVERS